MPLSSKTPMALAAIFESPSDDEDFLGFAMSVPSDSESDDSRDSLASEDSGKPAVRFRSKFVTAELCVAEESDALLSCFRSLQCEAEEGDALLSCFRSLQCVAEESDVLLSCFRSLQCEAEESDALLSCFRSLQCVAEESDALLSCFRSLQCVAEESDALLSCFRSLQCEAEEGDALLSCFRSLQCVAEESDALLSCFRSLQCVAEESDEDTGFYSEGEEPDTHTRRSLCVAFRFPTKRLSAKKGEAPKKPQPITTAPPERRTNEKEQLKRGVSQVSRGMVTRGQKQPLKKEEVESPILNKRAKNIQENKAMLAKLFADLTNMAELPPSTMKRRVSEKPTPRRRGVYEGGERRNPSRAARPPEKFGVEERSTSPSRHNRSVRTICVRKLLEVDDELSRSGKKRRASSGKRRKITHVRSVDEITEEELDNVAEGAKDKILDKDHGSTCHQCRQKTLDTKTVCRSGVCSGGKGQFCGPCLRNRYGEDVRSALLDPDWECPLCRGICNCSLCRRREGRCATGQLVHLAQHKGHSNVQDYLESIQKDLQA
ncbi:cell division cycle-associated 7-like protein isoform X2 [Salmo trutta]|uniref:cell division cycle-associated 7-like protein isoform X2 n=1 Tax=Salmo trutta TaxID=8032 RepID=UPI0011321DA0|nr:cell division cycle-associated 7-like protein isoform X2 [Salmo trutta]